MALQHMIDFIKSHEKNLILFNISDNDPLVVDMRERFETQNVRLRTVRTASGTPTLAVLSRDDAVLAVDRIPALREAFAADSDQSNQPAARASAQGISLLAHLKETTFTSYDKTQLLHASREIEDRARRVETGTIHSCFQHVSLMADQQHVYADLARRGVDVHAYGTPDAPVPDLGTARIHPLDSDELARSWFVVFDGGPDETQKSALIAQEEAPNAFYGAWTYDPQLVDQVCTYLEQTYLAPNASKSSQ